MHKRSPQDLIPATDVPIEVNVQLVNQHSMRALYARRMQEKAGPSEWQEGIGAKKITDCLEEGLWKFVPSNGGYQIINVYSNRVLCVGRGTDWEDGFGAIVPEASVSAATVWSLFRDGDCGVRIINRFSERCLYAQSNKNLAHGVGCSHSSHGYFLDAVWCIHVTKEPLQPTCRRPTIHVMSNGSQEVDSDLMTVFEGSPCSIVERMADLASNAQQPKELPKEPELCRIDATQPEEEPKEPELFRMESGTPVAAQSGELHMQDWFLQNAQEPAALDDAIFCHVAENRELRQRVAELEQQNGMLKLQNDQLRKDLDNAVQQELDLTIQQYPLP